MRQRWTEWRQPRAGQPARRVMITADGQGVIGSALLLRYVVNARVDLLAEREVGDAGQWAPLRPFASLRRTQMAERLGYPSKEVLSRRTGDASPISVDHVRDLEHRLMMFAYRERNMGASDVRGLGWLTAFAVELSLDDAGEIQQSDLSRWLSDLCTSGPTNSAEALVRGEALLGLLASAPNAASVTSLWERHSVEADVTIRGLVAVATRPPGGGALAAVHAAARIGPRCLPTIGEHLLGSPVGFRTMRIVTRMFQLCGHHPPSWWSSGGHTEILELRRFLLGMSTRQSLPDPYPARSLFLEALRESVAAARLSLERAEEERDVIRAKIKASASVSPGAPGAPAVSAGRAGPDGSVGRGGSGARGTVAEPDVTRLPELEFELNARIQRDEMWVSVAAPAIFHDRLVDPRRPRRERIYAALCQLELGLADPMDVLHLVNQESPAERAWGYLAELVAAARHRNVSVGQLLIGGDRRADGDTVDAAAEEDGEVAVGLPWEMSLVDDCAMSAGVGDGLSFIARLPASIQEATMQLIRYALLNPDGIARGRACDALREAAVTNESVGIVTAVIEHDRCPDWLREIGVFLLGQFGDPLAIPALQRVAASPAESDAVRHAAFFALGDLRKFDELTSRLIEEVVSADPRSGESTSAGVRHAATYALAVLRPDDVADAQVSQQELLHFIAHPNNRGVDDLMRSLATWGISTFERLRVRDEHLQQARIWGIDAVDLAGPPTEPAADVPRPASRRRKRRPVRPSGPLEPPQTS